MFIDGNEAISHQVSLNFISKRNTDYKSAMKVIAKQPMNDQIFKSQLPRLETPKNQFQ